MRELFGCDLLAAGINCAPGPQGTLDVLEYLKEPPGPLAVMPNAGSLVRREGRILLPPATPAYLGRFARRAVELGAALVGVMSHLFEQVDRRSEETRCKLNDPKP